MWYLLSLAGSSAGYHYVHHPHLPLNSLPHPRLSAHTAQRLGWADKQLMRHLLSLAGSSAGHHYVHHPHLPLNSLPHPHLSAHTAQRLGWADKQLMRHLLSLAGSSGLDSRSLLTFTKALSSRGEYDRDVSVAGGTQGASEAGEIVHRLSIRGLWSRFLTLTRALYQEGSMAET